VTTSDELTAISGWTDDELRDDVRATGVLFAARTLERLSLIELVERLNELNQNKLLSIGAGRASNLLHEFWDKGFRRMTPRRRAALFARLFGSPAGAAPPDAVSNDAFPGLWQGLVSALAEGSPEAVATAASELYDNLAEHTDEQTTAAAVELRGVFVEIAEALADMELLGAYGAHDMWQLVEHVGDEQFCGARDIERARTLADAGALILRRLPELREGSAAGSEFVQAAEAWHAADARLT